MTATPDISIVIPVYNSEASLGELIQRIDAALASTCQFEVLMIDDGSTDKSWDRIVALKSSYPSALKGIKLKRNFGQHNAIICGFSFALGKFIVTMDDDLQHPPEEIIKLIEQQKKTGADLVYGLPIDRKHSTIKKAGSYFIRRTSKYFAENPNGEGSSFRMISKDITDHIVRNHTNNFVFIDEIIHWYTNSVALVDVKHEERKFGKTGYSFLKLFKMYLDIFINYSANPLKMMIYGGIFSSVVSFVLAVKFIFRKIYVGAPLGYTSIIVSILFSTSIIMLCLGVIGKYIFNLYNQQRSKPLYGIDQII
ncbi:MAG: glycosyltransferase family 2 protein [Flavobacteriales bacterium]|nr:glycosyltransferase family 2 protein [Flavobacteriales bacterium]